MVFPEQLCSVGGCVRNTEFANPDGIQQTNKNQHSIAWVKKTRTLAEGKHGVSNFVALRRPLAQTPEPPGIHPGDPRPTAVAMPGADDPGLGAPAPHVTVPLQVQQHRERLPLRGAPRGEERRGGRSPGMTIGPIDTGTYGRWKRVQNYLVDSFHTLLMITHSKTEGRERKREGCAFLQHSPLGVAYEDILQCIT